MNAGRRRATPSLSTPLARSQRPAEPFDARLGGRTTPGMTKGPKRASAGPSESNEREESSHDRGNHPGRDAPMKLVVLFYAIALANASVLVLGARPAWLFTTVAILALVAAMTRLARKAQGL